MGDKKLISIEEVVRLFNISKATANYYTNLGLLPIAEKKGNQRLFDKGKVEATLKKIRSLRKEGYTLKLIQNSFLKFDRHR